MPLKPGTLLGQYEIQELIGVGGMGEVYRAHDNKLKRDVALKVLPEAFARDPDRVARFRREAQVLASLNHPNIAAIYNVEESGSVRFLVMELVLGETLRERIKRGPLPAEEAFDLCAQITEALEYAHGKPIIHRDLKPANVKVTPEGKVKVLDFGLAKAFVGDGPPVDPHDAPTGSLAGTLHGTVLGTPAYMSPEQASGKKADKRADIWAFGCVFYELVTGKQAFQGETVTEILASVLKAEPDWEALPQTTPANLRPLLQRCLQKDANRRFHSAADVRIEMEEGLTAPAATAVSLRAHISRRQALLWGLPALLIGSLLTGLAVWRLKPSPPRPVTRLVMALPAAIQVTSTFGSAVALSPDGMHLAYVAVQGSGRQIYLRTMDGFETKPIPGTEGGDGPFFSPDGQWIGFFAEGKLKKVPTNGGASQTLCDASSPRGANWGDNDTIVFAPTGISGIWRVPAVGGKPEPITTLKTEISHRWPELLPGGKAVVFTSGYVGAWDDAEIVLQRLDTGERQVLIKGGSNAHYVSTGHLMFARAGTLMAAPFDLGRLQVTGASVSVLEGVYESVGAGNALLSFSGTGSLVYVPGDNRNTFVWVDRKGAEQPLAAPPRPYMYPHLSPDGQRLVALTAGARGDVWVYDISHATLTRLTFEGANYTPIWTPDGKRVTFASARGAPHNLFWKLADGSGGEERLTTGKYTQFPSSWSPDGQTLAFVETNPTTGYDIWVVSLQGERKLRVFLQTPFNESYPAFSPDGRWLAYGSDESGRFEVYVRPFPGPGEKRQISTEGGTEPLWARNGRELFYRNGAKMMAVDVATQPTLTFGNPRLLFEGQYSNSVYRAFYDVTADSQRFLMVKPYAQESSWTQINVVLNWFEELRRKAPVTSGK